MQVITVNTKNIIKKSEQGFTLIELLVVIGILAILMGIVLIAINPARQFAQANDTDRTNAVTQILNAVGQYEADNHGQLPGGLAASTPAAATEIANGTGCAGGAGACYDLCTPLVTTTQYIPSFPEDPKIANGASITDCANYDSGYKVAVDANKRVTISATPEIQTAISVTR
jgi:prepilin-type N-terminal cleavage/methylation domain-containing protein